MVYNLVCISSAYNIDIAEWVLNKCALSRPPSSRDEHEKAYFGAELISSPLQVTVIESKTMPSPSIQGSMQDLLGQSGLPQQVSIEETDFGGNGSHLTKAEGKYM